ncbi:MAG: helix-turn-helix domain-containing protein [Betaproteobacteria bacterium]|nr:MAG: helix-turn-helix domain-containing protein [Betaproteobacteria bacterium]
MSNRLLTAVWERSSAKGGDLLVLLAIADRADDGGSAFPSIADISSRARMSPRNARRAIAHLHDAGELLLERGGGRSSNRYRVLVGGNSTADNLSPQPGQSVTPEVAPMSPQHCRPCHPSSTRLPRKGEQEPTYNHHGTHNPMVVAESLVWPERLTTAERQSILEMLSRHRIDPVTAQTVLDELSAAIGEKRVTRSPVGYARALIARAARGEFMPEHAHRVRGAREVREIGLERAPNVVLAGKVEEARPASRDVAVQHIRKMKVGCA